MTGRNESFNALSLASLPRIVTLTPLMQKVFPSTSTELFVKCRDTSKVAIDGSKLPPSKRMMRYAARGINEAAIVFPEKMYHHHHRTKRKAINLSGRMHTFSLLLLNFSPPSIFFSFFPRRTKTGKQGVISFSRRLFFLPQSEPDPENRFFARPPTHTH